MGNFSGRVSTSSTFRVPTTRPKVFNATLPHLSVARNHSRRLSREQNAPSRSRDALADPPVSRMRLFAHETSLADSFVSRTRRSAHETTLADSPVSRTRRFAHKTDSESPSVSRTHRLAHETTSADPPVSRTRRLAHETTLADPFVSRTRRSAHETTSEDPSVSRTRLFAHETAAKDTRGNRGAFSASYGNSMETLRGALRALYDAAEVRPEPVGLVIGLSAFRNRHLDG